MSNPSTNSDLVPIRHAAEILGVSIATVRRWEKQGKISSERSSGGHRLFAVKELKEFKKNRPFTISEAARELGISASSLRRFEKQGYIEPERNESGERVYTPAALAEFKRRKAKGLPKAEKAVKTEEKIAKAAVASAALLPLTKGEGVSNEELPAPTAPAPEGYQIKTALRYAVAAAAVFVFAASMLVAGKQIKSNVSKVATGLVVSTPGDDYIDPTEFKIADGSSGNGGRVLGVSKEEFDRFFEVNVPAFFNGELLQAQNITVLDALVVEGSITAPNLVNSVNGIGGDVTLTAGEGLEITDITFTNTDAGSAQQIYKNIKVGTTTIVADQNDDTLEVVAGENVTITPDASGDKITFAASADLESGKDITVTEGVVDINSELENVSIIKFSGTGKIQELDEIDGTTESTLESALDIGGDITGTGLAAVTIGNDKVLEKHLKAVDDAADEECLTFETTTGDFEWESCGTGITSFTLSGDAGSDQTIEDGNTLEVAGGDGITTTAAATDTITAAIDLLDSADGAGSTSTNSGLEFGGSSSDELGLLQGCSDAQLLKWNDTTNVWYCASGTGTSAFDITDGSTTQTISDSDTLTLTDGDDIDFVVSATDTVTADVIDDSLDFTEFEDTLDLDAALAINTSGNNISINEDGGDSDFRIEGDTNTHALFIDASGDNVGIGQSTVQYELDVSGSGRFTDILEVHGSSIGLNSDADTDNFLALSAAAGEAGSDIYWGDDLLCDVSETTCGWVTSSGSGSSKWTDGGAITYLTSETDDIAIGGTSSSAPFFFDESAELVTLTNTTSGNSFQVYDEASDSTPFVINSSGFVGIQDSTPQYALDVSGSGRFTEGLEIRTTGGTQQITFNTDGSAVFNEAGNDSDFKIEGDNETNLFFIDASTDNIGIADSTPQYTLDVSGSGRFTEGLVVTTTGGTQQIALNTDGSAVFNEAGSNSDFRIEGDTNTHALFIDASGDNVGIGQSTVQYELDVSGSGRFTDILEVHGSSIGLNSDADTDNFLALSAAAGEAGSDIYWGDDLLCDVSETTCGWVTSSGSGSSKWTDGGAITYLTSETDDLALGGTGSSSPFFYDEGNELLTLTNTTSGDSLIVNDASSDSTPFVINSSGFVGISDSTPQYTLDVSGSGRTVGAFYVQGTEIGLNNDADADNIIGFSAASGSASDDLYWGDDLVCDVSEATCGWVAVGGSGSSLFTDGGAITYLTSETDDVAFGGTSSSSPFFFDEGEEQLNLNSTTAEAALLINQDSTGLSISIDSEATATDVIDIASPATTTGNVFDVNADALTTGSILDLTSNSSSTGTRNLVNLVNDHASASGTTLLRLQQDSTGDITNFFDGGTEVFTILDGGNVGINDASPSYALDVTGTGRFTTDLLVDGTTIGLNRDADADNQLALAAAAGEAGSDLYWGDDLVCDVSETDCGGDNYASWVVADDDTDTYSIVSANTLRFTSSSGDITTNLTNGDDADENLDFGIADDSLDFAQFEDTLDLDAALTINTSSNNISINEDGGDSDFKIEGDNETNLFFIDASTDNIGIADSTPQYTLDVSGSGRFTEGLVVTTTGGTQQIALNTDGSAVFNEAGSNSDFRIEGDTNTHALFIDASGDNVGIGQSTVQYELDVSGSGRFTDILEVHGSSIGLNSDADTDNFLALSAAAGEAGSDIYWGDDLLCDVSETTCGWVTSSGSGSSKWTDGGAITYLTSETDDIAIGGTSSSAPLFFDESEEQLNLNSTTSNAALLINQDSTGLSLQIDSEATATDVIDIASPATTTGIIFDVNADTLTTGSILDLTSDSSDTGTRTLVQLTNDNTAATGATLLRLQQDSTGDIFQVFDGASQVITINDEGSFGLRTATPQYTLDVSGSGRFTDTLVVDQGDTDDIVNFFDDGTEVFTILDGGNVGLTNAAPSYDLDVTGTVRTTEGLLVDGTTIGLNRDADADNQLALAAAAGEAGSDLYWGDDLLCDASETTCGFVTAGGSGSSLFTDGGAITYLTSETDDFALGGTSSSAPFFFDEGEEQLNLNSTTSSAALLINQDSTGLAISIDAESTASDVVEIVEAQTTTGFILDIQASSLTTGSIANLVSDSSDTGTRSLVNVVNDNSSATGTTVLNVQQDAGADAVTIDHNGSTGGGNSLDIVHDSNVAVISIDDNHSNGEVIDATTDNSSVNIIKLSAASLTSGFATSYTNANSLTSGGFLQFSSNSGNTTARDLVYVDNNNAAATGATVLNLKQDSTGAFLTLDDAGTDVWTFGDGGVTTLADGASLDLSSVNMSSTTEGIHLGQTTDCSSATAEGQTCWDSDDDALYVGDGSTANEVGGGASLFTDGGASTYLTSTSDYLAIGTKSAAAQFEVETTNGGSVAGLLIDGNDIDQIALQIDSESTSTFAVEIAHAGDGGTESAAGLRVVAESGAGAAHFYGNVGSDTDGDLVWIEQDNSSADRDALYIQNDGTGVGIDLDQNGAANAINVTSTDGSNDTVYISTSSTNANLTSATLDISHTQVTTSGSNTLTDGALAVTSTGTQVVGGDITKSDNVFSITSNCTGTCTDSSTLASFTQSHADNTGDALFINQDSTSSAEGIVIDQESTGLALNVDYSTDNDIVDVLAENTSFSNDILVLRANEESSGTFNFLRFNVDVDGTETTVFTVDQDGKTSILADEGSDAVIVLDADNGDNDADTWTIESEASGNDLSILNHTTEVLNLTTAGNFQVDGTGEFHGATLGLNNDADADNLFGLSAAAGQAGADLYWGDDLLCDVSESTCGWSAGSSLFTDGGAITYLTSETDDVAFGGTSSSSPFFFDEGEEQLNLNSVTSDPTLLINQDSTGLSLQIDSEATATDVIDIASPTTTTGNVFDVNADALTTGRIFDITSNTSNTGAIELVYIHNDNPLATGVTPLHIRQDASDSVVFIDQNANGNAIEIDIEATSADAISITNPQQTTGHIFDVDADALTTGSIINATSDSSDTSTRELLYLINNHASATGTNVAVFRQDSTDHNVIIDSNGDAISLKIDSEATTKDIIDVEAPTVTSGFVFDVNANSLTTGRIFNLTSNSSDNTSRDLVSIKNDHSSATGTTVLNLQQDSTGNFLILDDAGTDVWTFGDGGVTTLADGASLDFSSVNMSDTTEGLHLGQTTDCSSATAEGQTCWDSDDDALYVGDGSAASQVGGSGAATTLQDAYDNDADGSNSIIALTSADDSIIIRDPAASGSDSTFAVEIEQNTNAVGLLIDHNGGGNSGIGLQVDHEGTNSDAIDVNTTATTGYALHLQGDSLTNGSLGYINSNSSSSSTRTLFNIINDNTSATATTVLQVRQDAATQAIKIDQNGNGDAINIDSEATTSGSALDISAPANTTAHVITMTPNALTTGAGIFLQSNASATNSRNLVDIQNFNASANSATVLNIQQRADHRAVFINMDSNAEAIQIDSDATSINVIDIPTPLNTTGDIVTIDNANSLTTGSILFLDSDSSDTSTRYLVDIVQDHASASGAVPLRIQQDSTADIFQAYDGASEAFDIQDGGDVTGTHGSYHTASDRNLKKEIVTISNSLSKVLALRGVNYKWNDVNFDQDSVQMGFIAQEVEQVIPEVVHTSLHKEDEEDEGHTQKAVEYQYITALLVEATKEQNAQVQSLAQIVGTDANAINVESDRDDIRQSILDRLTALEANVSALARPLDKGESEGVAEAPIEVVEVINANLESLVVTDEFTVMSDAHFYEGLIADTISVTDAVFIHGDTHLFGDLSVEGEFSVSIQQAGTATIPRGGREVTVEFDEPFLNTPRVQVTPNGIAPTYYVSESSADEFTITITELAQEEVTFTWNAITAPDADTTLGEVVDENNNGIPDIDEVPSPSSEGEPEGVETEPEEVAEPVTEPATAPETAINNENATSAAPLGGEVTEQDTVEGVQVNESTGGLVIL